MEDAQAASEVSKNWSTDVAAALGPSFADTSLPVESRVMLGSFRRAQAYRRRAARQYELLEKEVSSNMTTNVLDVDEGCCLFLEYCTRYLFRGQGNYDDG